MSGYGGNLTFPVKPLLFNSLSTKDFGVYTNSVTGNKHLLFKKHGFDIKLLNSSDDLAITRTKIEGKAFTHRVALVELPTVAPCNDCNFEYGINITREVENPGVLNSERYPFMIHYGGKIRKISSTNGVIDDTHQETMRNDIIDQITKHKRYNQQGFDAWVTAAIAKIVTYDTEKTLTINGAAITVGNNITAFITNINATTAAKVKAYKLGSAQVVLIGEKGETTMTLAKTGAGTIMTVDSYNYIGLTGCVEEVMFHVVDATAQVTVTYIVHGNYSVNGPDKVFRIFSHLQHDGALANQHRVEKPENELYNKYIFEIDMKSFGFHGASEGHDYKQEVVIYVKKSLVDTAIWDYSNLMWESTADDSGFEADTTFEGLLGYES